MIVSFSCTARNTLSSQKSKCKRSRSRIRIRTEVEVVVVDGSNNIIALLHNVMMLCFLGFPVSLLCSPFFVLCINKKGTQENN